MAKGSRNLKDKRPGGGGGGHRSSSREEMIPTELRFGKVKQRTRKYTAPCSVSADPMTGALKLQWLGARKAEADDTRATTAKKTKQRRSK